MNVHRTAGARQRLYSVPRTRGQFPVVPTEAWGEHVYFLRDGAGAIVYVGRTQYIRARLAQHFTHRPMKPDAVGWEFLRLKTHADAVAMEKALIRLLRPRYNIQFNPSRSAA